MSFEGEISLRGRHHGQGNQIVEDSYEGHDEVSNDIFQTVGQQGRYVYIRGVEGEVMGPNNPPEEPMDETSDNECVGVPRYSQSIIMHPCNIEKNRYETYHNLWPQSFPVSAEDLAKAGFKYIGPGDRVKCVFCNGILSNFEEGDNALEEHHKHFPNCLFVRGENVNNVPYERLRHVATIERSIPARIQSTFVRPASAQRPKHPQYSVKSERLVTFNDWPSQIRQKPEDMAEAGLFYLGQGDKVKCFFCDGMLHTWDPDDEPWIEHAKWFHKCEFVKIMKGDQFIRKVASGEITTVKCNESTPRASSASGTSRRDLENTQAVREVLDNGKTMDQVVNALKTMGIGQQQELPNSKLILQTIDKQHTEAKDSATNSKPPEEYASLEEENRYLKEQRLCKICLENDVSVIFLPCGHVCCCAECSMSVSTCPMCRTDIESRSKAFIS